MITASELGMLCARHKVKSASWLTEGIRSWSAPKPPDMNLTKDQKPQAQPNPYAKASEQPSPSESKSKWFAIKSASLRPVKQMDLVN